MSFELTSLLSKDLLFDLLKYFTFAVCGLLFLYLIFTSFELWRFAASSPAGFQILGKYLFYISPIVVFQIVPSALLLAVLFAYGIRSKKSELIAWNSAGQNLFRLLIPAFVLSVAIGCGTLVMQDKLLPQANRRQDALRAQLRGGASAVSPEGRFWFAASGKIYSFVTDRKGDKNQTTLLREIEIYEFAGDNFNLKRMLRSDLGFWENGNIKLNNKQQITWKNSLVEIENFKEPEIVSSEEGNIDLSLGGSRFFYLSLSDLQERLKITDSESEKRRIKVAIQKHFTVVVMPFAIVLFSAPFAVTFGRRNSSGKANLSLVYVIGIWLLFMALTSLFEQLGNSGFFNDYIAAWAPLLILLSLGMYFFANTEN